MEQRRVSFGSANAAPLTCCALFPGDMWTLVRAHVSKAGPGSTTYSFSNVFRRIKARGTYTSVSSLVLSQTRLRRHGDPHWLATHTGLGLAHTLAHTLMRTASTGTC